MESRDISRISERLFLRRLLLAVGVVLAVGLLVAGVWLSIHVWLAVFAGILLAVFLSTLTGWVSRITHLPRGWALASVLVVLLGLAVLGGWLLAPKVAEQFTELTQRLPKALDHIRERAQQTGLSRYLPTKMPPSSEWANSAGKVAGKAAGFFSLSVGAVTTVFVILFLGIYLAASPQIYLRGATHLRGKLRLLGRPGPPGRLFGHPFAQADQPPTAFSASTIARNHCRKPVSEIACYHPTMVHGKCV